jgi:hypothetical protein
MLLRLLALKVARVLLVMVLVLALAVKRRRRRLRGVVELAVNVLQPKTLRAGRGI